MKFLLIYAHPNTQSFNHALFQTTKRALEAARHEVRVHDLYAMKFNPVLEAADFEAMQQGGQREDIAALQADISWADRLFFTYPIWWYGRPAILQGYIDRVFSHGFAYGKGQGLLRHDRALIFQTTGQTRDDYTGQGDVTIHYAMKEGTLEFCGLKNVVAHTFYSVPRASEEKRQEMLAEAGKLVADFMQ